MRNRSHSSCLPVAVTFLLLAPAASAVNIEWVTVGDPGNACDTQTAGCFGAVANVYRISKRASGAEADSSFNAPLWRRRGLSKER